MTLEKTLQDKLDSHHLKEGKHLLAFSAGPDSVYLLLQLSLYWKDDLPKHVSLIYVDYHDSPYVPLEESLVLDYQNKYQLQLFRKDVQFYKEKDKNFEDWARTARYDFFEETAKRYGFDDVFTAHHLNDSLETYLIQKERHNLPLSYGLSFQSRLGNLTVLRPLVEVPKRRILETLKSGNIPYFDDPTNAHTTRGSLRKEAYSEEDILNLEKEIQSKNQQLVSLYSYFDSLPSPYSKIKYDSLSEDEQKRFCFYLLDKHSLKEKREGKGKELFDFLKSKENGELKLSDSLFAYRTKDYFFLAPDFSSLFYDYVFDKPGIYKTKEFTLDLRNPKLFNLSSFPIRIRNHREEDSFSTDLLPHEVSSFLKKQQVPYFLRNIYPTFLEGDQIKGVPFYSDLPSLPFAFFFEEEKSVRIVNS